MKSYLIVMLALAIQCSASTVSLRFFVLPENATPPKEKSSFLEFQKNQPKLGAAVLDVDSLTAVKLITDHSVNRTADAKGNITEERLDENPAIIITWPAGVAEKFAQITEENRGHHILIVLGDQILMAPMVMQSISTESIQISLRKSITPDEAKRIIDSLNAMVVRKEPTKSPEQAR